MGAAKKKGGSLKIPVRAKSKSGDCFEELNSFMACMARNSFEVDERCAAERRALAECATAAARRPKVVQTLNYHLQRISRLMK